MDVGESSDIQEGNGGGIPEFRESSGPTHNLVGAEPVGNYQNYTFLRHKTFINMVKLKEGWDSNDVWIFMIACSMQKLLMQVCVSFQCEQKMELLAQVYRQH